MQLGFVIDHSRCIGCHACTVACKSENEVPLGDFRTWVKYTEEGTFPDVKRSFAVLRCNQCTDAPCIEICPTSALTKGPQGIVDIQSKVCIGCKSCMHGCPYDALYINEEEGTAEKCHFCAHRTEMGLAPACAVVCPTEAIIPGDFHDPESMVSQMKRDYDLSARKEEAGTGPNVFYRDVERAGIDPALTNISTGSIWSELPEGPHVDAQIFEALEKKAEARTVYDVPRKQLWGNKITGYLFAKSISAGLFPLGVLAIGSMVDVSAVTRWMVPLLAVIALAVTGGLLIGDLRRPDRFFLILIRPNWSSWLARGTVAISAYGGLLVAWMALLLFSGPDDSFLRGFLFWTTTGFALATSAYTGWLFGQAKGRVLWMKRGYWAHLLCQAGVGGAGTLLLLYPILDITGSGLDLLRFALAMSIIGHAAFTFLEGRCAPAGREKEFHRAARLITHGPYAKRHWREGVLLGIVLPLILLSIFSNPLLLLVAGGFALYGLWVEEDVFVRAGQALPIS